MSFTTSESVNVPAPPDRAEETVSDAANATPRTSPPSPNKPLIVIEPARTLAHLNLRDVWAYRELLYFLTWRDVKVRYKQTALGAAWAILQPVLMMVVFSLFFGRQADVRASAAVPYPLFAFAGLVPWTFFANAVTSSGNSLVNSAGLITKVYFPRLLVPAAAMAACFGDFALAFIVLAAMIIFYDVNLTSSLLMLPALIALTALFALGVGMWLAALNVKYRDVRFALPFLIQLWLFVSSVILPSSALPAGWRRLLVLNPMSGIIEGYRSALFGKPFDWQALAVAAVITLLVLVYSAYSFRRMEREFADII